MVRPLAYRVSRGGEVRNTPSLDQAMPGSSSWKRAVAVKTAGEARTDLSGLMSVGADSPASRLLPPGKNARPSEQANDNPLLIRTNDNQPRQYGR
jgi:hypothetical protein